MKTQPQSFGEDQGKPKLAYNSETILKGGELSIYTKTTEGSNTCVVITSRQ